MRRQEQRSSDSLFMCAVIRRKIYSISEGVSSRNPARYVLMNTISMVVTIIACNALFLKIDGSRSKQ